MGKHISRKKYISWFKKYESKEFEWNLYYNTRNLSGSKKSFKNAKYCFRKKYISWKISHNLFMINNTNRVRSKKIDSDLLKKEKFEKELEKTNIEDLKEIARRYYEITKDNNKRDTATEVSNVNISASKAERLFDVSRQTISKRRNGFIPKKHRQSKTTKYYKVISEEFVLNYKRYGRERLSKHIELKYGIIIPARTLGYNMNKLELLCKVRKAKRKSENKNLNVKYMDLVKRNYNPTKNNIFATDVKYLRCNDLENNFGYLSIIISHKTKLIESFKFSEKNNISLVVKTYDDFKRKNIVMHSDHGSQYSSYEIKNLCVKKNIKISMSRIGNSLDNREAEYFFSNLESELLKFLPLYKMKFKTVTDKITEYIKWYNTKRIQKVLNWKTPARADVINC